MGHSLKKRANHLRLVPPPPPPAPKPPKAKWKHTCIQPDMKWNECVCSKIHPDDLPCVVCVLREAAERNCRACKVTHTTLVKA